jgi:hypothetical protein
MKDEIRERARTFPKAKFRAALYTDEQPKFDRFTTKRVTETTKIVSKGKSGYSPSSPRKEGRTAGDIHADKSLRHEKHTGARTETTQRQPKSLSSQELKRFLAYAKSHQWDSNGDVRPSDFIKKTFARWLELGLSRTNIVAAQANLAQAYATEISRNPERRVEALIVRPHSIPPGEKRALSARLVSELTAAELELKRAMERDKKQRQRLLKKPKNLSQ